MDRSFISHTTTFKIYRMLDQQYLSSDLPRTKYCPSNNQYYTTKKLCQLEFLYNKLGNGSLDVLTSSSNAKHESKYFRFHNYTGSYPAGSFLKLKDNIYLASPELLFCQMAQNLSIEKLLLLGFELCGTYSVYPESETGFISNVKP